MKAIIWFLLTILGILLFAACDTTTTSQHKLTVYAVVKDGTNIRIITVTSDEYYWNRKQEEIVPHLERIINTGEYNIVSVKTFYSDTYLTSAEVKYSIAEDCARKNLRVIFLHSDKYYWNMKSEELKPKLEAVVNSGDYDIQEVNTIMLQGYLVAAEVYYSEK